MHYRLLSTWRLESPLEPVFWRLHDAESWPDWWPGVVSVRKLEEGDELGVGSLGRYVWRSRLPYELSFDVRTTRVEPLRVLAGEATGELSGRGTWTFEERDGASSAVYEWDVATTRRWMNALGPALRRAFVWNHDAIMRAGARGLARDLGVHLL